MNRNAALKPLAGRFLPATVEIPRGFCIIAAVMLRSVLSNGNPVAAAAASASYYYPLEAGTS